MATVPICDFGNRNKSVFNRVHSWADVFQIPRLQQYLDVGCYMKKFVVKYWPTLLSFMTLNVLIWLVIPYQERYYLEADINAIKKQSNSVLCWTELVLIATIFLFLAFKHYKSLENMLILTFSTAMISFAFFLFFDSIFLSATFFLNNLSKNKTIDKTYSIIYIDKEKKQLLLCDKDLRVSIPSDFIVRQNDIATLNLKDTVIVSFKKGLLGFNFDPHLKVK